MGCSVPAFPARVESRAAAPVYLRAKIIKIGLSAVFILFFNCCLFLKTAGSAGLPCRVGSGTGRQAVRRVCGMPSLRMRGGSRRGRGAVRKRRYGDFGVPVITLHNYTENASATCMNIHRCSTRMASHRADGFPAANTRVLSMTAKCLIISRLCCMR